MLGVFMSLMSCQKDIPDLEIVPFDDVNFELLRITNYEVIGAGTVIIKVQFERLIDVSKYPNIKGVVVFQDGNELFKITTPEQNDFVKLGSFPAGFVCYELAFFTEGDGISRKTDPFCIDL